MPAWSHSSEDSLSSLQMTTSSLCVHTAPPWCVLRESERQRGRDRELSLSLFLQGPTLVASFNLNYDLKVYLHKQ